MSVIEEINRRVLILPVEKQAEVLNFVDFLLSRTDPAQLKELNETEWSHFSITMAMKDEDEPEYSLADTRQPFDD